MSQEFRLINMDKTGGYFLEEIKQNELMCKKHKMVCTVLNYIEHFLIKLLRLLDAFRFLFLVL